MIRSSVRPWRVAAFETALGWMAALGNDDCLRQLSFGHDSPQAALGSLNANLLGLSEPSDWRPELIERLTAFALGAADDFADVRVDLQGLTSFQQSVVRLCRQIPYGQTRSYGALALAAGNPGAARAVGNCMACNRLPLVVPCHRVVHSDGSYGRFSAPQGTVMKTRLLRMESAAALLGEPALS